jgi:hypothetical protein
MSWIAFFRVVMSLANSVATIIREKQLMDAGEAKATAKSLASLSSRLGIAQAVATEVANLTDIELDSDLKGD